MSDVAGAIAKSYAKWDRKPADFYKTPLDATQALLNALGPMKPLRIREPACGTGDMAHVLAGAGHNVLASDIRYTGYGTPEVDYLNVEYDDGDVDAVITNPPFSLAEEFIRKAVKEARLVAMLLKADYWNAQRGMQLFSEFPPTMEYKLTWRPAFAEERGNNPLMTCSWFVWRRGAPFTAGWRPVPRPDKDTLPIYDPPPLVKAFGRLETAVAGLTEALAA